jgi:hypothetical protein
MKCLKIQWLIWLIWLIIASPTFSHDVGSSWSIPVSTPHLWSTYTALVEGKSAESSMFKE